MTDGLPALERVTDAFVAADREWRITYANDRAAALLECDEVPTGRDLWAAVPDPLERQLSQPVTRAVEEGEARSFDVSCPSTAAYFDGRAYPSGSGVSITLREVADPGRLSHDAVIDAVRDGVVTLDDEGRVVTIDTTVERVLGVDPEAAAGAPLERLLERAAVDDADAADVRRAVDAVGAGTARRTLDVEYAGADGTTRVGELRLVPLEGRTADVAAVIRDVTDRRERERIAASLHGVTRRLVRASDPEEICSMAVHAASDLLDLPISGVWLLDDRRGRLEPVAATAGAHDEFGGLPRFGRGEGLVWRAFEDGELARYDDLREEDGLYNPETPLRSELIAPIGTHGVLMTGSFELRRFDGADVDLVSTLVENARAALDRAARERVLRDRTDRLERQTDRLETVATILSEDVSRLLESVDDALEGSGSADAGPRGRDDGSRGRDETAARTLERVDRLIDDLGELTRTAGVRGARSRIDLGDAVEEASANAGADLEVVLEEPATLRAAPDRLVRLLETLADELAGRSGSETTVRAGPVGLDDPPGGPRGFYLLADGAGPVGDGAPSTADRAVAGTADRAVAGAREPGGDPLADDVSSDALGVAVARAIAGAHGWSLAVDGGVPRFEVRGVTTLERP